MTVVATELVSRLKPPEVAELVMSQLSVANYLAAPEPLRPAPDRAYSTNEDLWDDILGSEARAACVLTLTSFLVSEWLPFSAGVFHSESGRHARKQAQHAILYDGRQPDARQTENFERAFPDIDLRSLGQVKIYSSAGKGGMISGGVGSIRLKPRRIDAGEVWFMSASSTGVAHEGFPIALPTEIYARHADELKRSGAVRCTLIGELRFVENAMRSLYGSRVPQLYLLVTELLPRPLAGPAQLTVSIPVSFQSPDGAVHAAYANFRPAEPGSLERATEWLHETYVTRIYNGRVITDFDEQIRWFDDADFSLEKIMTGNLDPGQAGRYAEHLHLGQHMRTTVIEQATFIERINIVHQERVIQIGPGTEINAPITIADSIEGSFNTIQASPASDELKLALQELTQAVAEAARSATPEQAATMGSDLQTLTNEATKETPRREWYNLSIASLREAAQTLGEIGIPIINLAARVAGLLD